MAATIRANGAPATSLASRTFSAFGAANRQKHDLPIFRRGTMWWPLLLGATTAVLAFHRFYDARVREPGTLSGLDDGLE